MAELTYDIVVAKYVSLRDKIEAANEEHKQNIAPMVEAKGKIEQWLHSRMALDKVKNVRTDAGTAYIKETLNVKVVDLGALESFAGNGEEQLFKSVPDTDAIKAYIEEHAGHVPEGVDVSYFTQAVVRRA